MISRKKKRILRSVFSICCAVTIASVTTSVYAAPSSKELEGKTSQLQGELNSLNSELASLSNELDTTSAQIETLAADVEKAKLDLAAAQLNEEAQYDSMKTRIKFMYEGGNISLLEILFSSEDMTDFLNKAEYVTSISEYDREMLDELRAIRNDIEKKQSDLESQQDELSELKDELTEKQENLNAKISSTSGQLADYSAQLERARAAEAALAAAQNNEISGSISENGGEGNQANGNGGGTISGPSIPANTTDVALLAAIIQCEAGNNSEGMLAVATVILNRVSSPLFPNNIRDVVYQRNQFSPVSNGSLNAVLSSGPSSSAYSVAQSAIGGARHGSVSGCLYFNAAWTGRPGINVGGNVFW